MGVARKRICWITPDYFLRWDAPVVPHLVEHYEVDWFVIRSHARNNSDRLTDGVVDGTFCVPKPVDLRYRQRDPRIIRQYIALSNEIRNAEYDLVYTSFHGMPYFLPILAARVDANKIIYAVHNASTPRGASSERAMRLYHRYVFSVLRRFQVFSKYQLTAIASMAPDGKHYYAPLVVADDSPLTPTPPEEPIRFLFFGYIKRYKRLDILIEAFQRLCAAGTAPIELHIAGACNDWGIYRDMIGGDPRIVTRVELIPAADIPNLFGSCHYLVLPYQDIAQSGVLNLAFQYGKPAIVSNIEGFRQSVVEGSTGFFFESESVDDLSAAMGEVVAKHRSRYGEMQESIRQLVAREYSIDAIVTRYRAFIDETMESQRA